MVVHQVLVNGDEAADVAVIPLGDRYYSLYEPCIIKACTDEGVFTFAFKEKFFTNYRSGGKLVDFFIDQIGNAKTQIAYLLHDACYTPCWALKMEHPISRKLADELLKAMLVYAGMSSWKASLVYTSVRLFGASAYEEDDVLTAENSKLFTFTWEAA